MSDPQSESTRATAEMLKALTDFVARMGPAVGVRRDGLHKEDDDSRPAVVIARDDALVAAFEAIDRIADSIRVTPRES